MLSDPSRLTALLASLTTIPVQVSSRADQSMHLCLSYGGGLASRNVIELADLLGDENEKGHQAPTPKHLADAHRIRGSSIAKTKRPKIRASL
jgi:hypothetical protein